MFYEIRIEPLPHINGKIYTSITRGQIKAIIRNAFKKAGWELSEEGVEIFNED